MKATQVTFRVDASVDIGIGHVMRCLTLAEELRAAGATCRFICREHRGHLGSLIRQRGFEAALLPIARQDESLVEPGGYAAWLGATWSEDAIQTSAALAQHGNQDWLVVDHYALDAQWERAVACKARHILVIDDLANRRHEANILLDQTIGRASDDYRSLVNLDCELRCGIEHVLLRPDYDDWRKYSLERRKLAKLENVVISLGGIDKDNYSREALLALHESSLAKDLHISLILSESSPWVSSLRNLIDSMALAVELKVAVNNMPELLASCDLAIGAAGTSAWERCCLGVPTLMLVLADNQREIAGRLAAAGAARLLDVTHDLKRQLTTALDSLAATPTLLQTLSRNAANLVPGSGAKQLACKMMEAA